MVKDHLPWFAFYPKDWLSDPELRSCSPAARGLLADLLCLMDGMENRGVLTTNGTPWTSERVAAAVTGFATDLLDVCLRELEENGVLSRTEHGAICSKRMVRDEQIRQERAIAGRKGGLAKASKHGSKALAPSNSNSISTSSKGGVGGKRNEYSAKVLQVYAEYPKKKAKGPALAAIRKALERVDFEVLLTRTRTFAVAQEPKRNTPEWKFVPYPATWFNSDGWEDEADPVPGATTKTVQPGGPSRKEQAGMDARATAIRTAAYKWWANLTPTKQLELTNGHSPVASDGEIALAEFDTAKRPGFEEK